MRRRVEGFTLLEVLVALGIVVLSLAAIGASMIQMIEAANTMRDRTYASWIAQNRIAEIRLAPEPATPGRSNGTVEYGAVEWDWRAVIAETGVEDLYRIDVSVSLAGNEGGIRTVTGFVGPPGSPGIANAAYVQQSGGNRNSGGPRQ